MSRIVCQFSCGAASAVATKLALAQYRPDQEVVVLNAYIKQEDEDNRRFATECEGWFGVPLVTLSHPKYDGDVIQVFKTVRFMKGPRGAPCTRILKRELLNGFSQPGDILVLGFTAEEADRLDDFRERFPDRPAVAPLVERGLTKEDCKTMVMRAGIALPRMYLLGYENANCKGCVKGGEAYFRAVREDFPAEFEELCKVQDELGPGSYLHRNRKTDVRFSLRELGDGPVSRHEPLGSCSFFCEQAEQEYSA